MAQKNPVVIVISGGSIQAIYTDTDIRIVLVDLDNIARVNNAGYFATIPLQAMPGRLWAEVIDMFLRALA